MKFRSHNQHTAGIHRLQAFCGIVRFGQCRKSLNRTHSDVIGLWKAAHVFLRDFGQLLIVDPVASLDIEKDLRNNSSARAGRTLVSPARTTMASDFSGASTTRRRAAWVANTRAAMINSKVNRRRDRMRVASDCTSHVTKEIMSRGI